MNITSPAVTSNTLPSTTSAPEIASVLVVTQASLSLVAGLSAIPFGIVEPGFRVLSLITILIAIGMFWLARNLRRQRRWARRWVIALEAVSLLASLLLTVLPIGAMRGPVPVLVNLVMPAAVLVLLISRSGRAAFARPGTTA
jgi:asparagine N-glycosylation enzyme membrane subunit Stt3